MPAPFHLKLTADFFDASGRSRFDDLGLSVLSTAPHIKCQPFAEHRTEIVPEQLTGANAVVVLTPAVTARSISEAPDLLAISRFGVGYDSVDIKACTAADVAVVITTGAVDRSVAEATVGWMIALSHRVWAKDRLVRTGEWDARSRLMGIELRERTLGLVGFGGIARAVLALLRNWGMQPPLVYDPFVREDVVAAEGARRVALEVLLRKSDFVSIHCPLNEQTRGLIGAAELALMRPTAFLLNTARGGIVDEAALYAALKSGSLAGAALDCFSVEPVTSPPALAGLENVLLAPHCIAWTNELFRDIGRMAFQGVVDLSFGKKPGGVVNPEVFARPTFNQKWKRICRD